MKERINSIYNLNATGLLKSINISEYNIQKQCNKHTEIAHINENTYTNKMVRIFGLAHLHKSR